MEVTRLDVGKVSAKLERTPQGGIRVDAALTRSGVFVYYNPDGSKRREYRPQSEVEKAESLAMLRDAPVTIDHPRNDTQLVSSEDYSSLSVGHVSGVPRMEGTKVVASLAIQDKRGVTFVEKGAREISCGYQCALEFSSGKTDAGESYDVIQRNIRYNHVALVHKGRAGKDIALRLDSDGNQVPYGEETMKTFEIISGVKYETGTEAHAKAAKERDAESVASAARLDSLTAKCAELQAVVDAQPKAIAEAVDSRVELVLSASKCGIEVDRADSDDDVRRKILAKLSPRLDCADKSGVYLETALDFALANRPGNATDGVKTRTDKAPEEEVGEAPDVIAQNKMIERLTAASQGNK